MRASLDLQNWKLLTQEAIIKRRKIDEFLESKIKDQKKKKYRKIFFSTKNTGKESI
jgi:hypothetical protein